MSTLKRRIDRAEDYIVDVFGHDLPTPLERRWIRLLERGQHVEELRRYFERKETERLATFDDKKDPYRLAPQDVQQTPITSNPSPADGSLETTRPDEKEG